MSGLNIAGSGLSLVDPLTSANVALAVGATAISGGTTGSLLYDSAAKLGELLMGAGVQTGLTTATGTTGGFLTVPASLTSTVSGVLPVANGGTAATTGIGAMTALSGIYSLACSGVSATTAATTEGTGVQLFANIPGNTLGANGVIELHAFLDAKSMTSAASVAVRYSAGSGAGTSGTASIGTGITAGNNLWLYARIAAAGATNAQIGNSSGSGSTTLTTNAYTTFAVDSTTASVVRLNLYCPTGGGTAVVRSFQVKLTTSAGT